MPNASQASSTELASACVHWRNMACEPGARRVGESDFWDGLDSWTVRPFYRHIEKCLPTHKQNATTVQTVRNCPEQEVLLSPCLVSTSPRAPWLSLSKRGIIGILRVGVFGHQASWQLRKPCAPRIALPLVPAHPVARWAMRGAEPLLARSVSVVRGTLLSG